MANIDKEQYADKGIVKITDNGKIAIIDNKFNSNYLIQNHQLTNSNENIFIFDNNSGKDTINNVNLNDKIILKDAFLYNAGNVSNIKFTKTSQYNDLIIKKNFNSKGKAKDTITVKNFFDSETIPEILLNGSYSEQTYSGNKISISSYFIETTGSGEIYGTKDYNNKILGSKKSDTIYSYNKTNFLYGGKSNDTYNLTIGKDIFNDIRIKKGEGNDTINLNWSAYLQDFEDIGIPNFIFDSDSTLYYEKENNDLIIKAKHSNNRTESARIKNYFVLNTESGSIHNIEDERIGNKLTTTIGELGDKTQLNINNINLSINSFLSDKNKNWHIFNGSDYDDTFIGNNKNNDIYTYGGQNNITTGKKGGTVITSINNGNDTINITNLSSGTIINNDDGNDTLNINNTKINDIHTVKLGTSLFITTSSGLNTLKNYSTSADDYTLAKNLKGCLIKNYFNSEDEVISNITVNIVNSGETIKYTYNNNEIFDKYVNIKINNYLTDLANEGLYYDNIVDLLSAQGNSASERKRINKAKKGLINIYKNWYIGSDLANNFTINKNGAIIESYKGSGTYNFKGILGGEKTIIFSNIDYDKKEKDLFVFNKYSFEDKNLFMGTYNNEYDDKPTFSITTVDYKKSKYCAEHNITYVLEDEVRLLTNTLDSYLTIKDSKRSYEISAYKSNTQEKIDTSADTKNHILLIMTDNKNITSNSGHNLIYTAINDATENNHGEMIYLYNGGYDYISSSGYSDDTYNIAMANNIHVEINDNEGTDTLKITRATTNNLRLFTKVKIINKDYYEYDNNRFILTNETLMNKSNIISKDGNTYATTGISIWGDIEKIYIGSNTNGTVDIQKWLDEVACNVSEWLYDNKWGYTSSTEVLESGNKTAITSLLNVYTNVNGNYYKQ